MIKDYDVIYANENGDTKECLVTATDVRHAINTALEFHPDAQRILRVTPKGMF